MENEESSCVTKCVNKSGKEILLGRGSYGNVFKGVFNRNGVKIDCAIKEMSYRGVSGFGNLNEIEMLVRLSKSRFFPKILTILSDNYEYCSRSSELKRNEFLSIVFELAISSCSSIFKIGNYSLSEAKRMISQILLGVNYMHKKGISHRDLKPSNLLFLRDKNNKILIKITDFGLSTILPHKDDRDKDVHTIWYRAPEIHHGVVNYKTTADIWSLGVIFYEIIVGPHMFQEVGDEPSMSKYLEFCISKIADDFTPELQQIYRANSNETPMIYKKRDIRVFRKTVQNYTGDFQLKNRFEVKPSFEEINNCSDLVMSCLTFDYRNRTPALKLLKMPFLESKKEYINTVLKEEHIEDSFDCIYFVVPKAINDKKIAYFTEAIKRINFMSIRKFFYAVDIVNRFFTLFPDYDIDKVDDVFASILYTVYKMFNFISYPKYPEKFFFHKFGTNITDEKFKELDIFIHNFEKIFLLKKEGSAKLLFFPIIRKCLYDMQIRYKNYIQPNEKHSLSVDQLKLLFVKFCELEQWTENRSYRYMYRLFYNQYIDSTFDINQ